MEYDTTHQWQTVEMWRKQIERRVFELSALVKGNAPTQSDRILEIVEQIEQVRKELKEELEKITTRQDKMAAWLKDKCSKCNGEK